MQKVQELVPACASLSELCRVKSVPSTLDEDAQVDIMLSYKLKDAVDDVRL